MKVYKFDCLGRVPASIEELKKCELCQNEEICMGLSSGSVYGSTVYDQDSPGSYRHSDRDYSYDDWKK